MPSTKAICNAKPPAPRPALATTNAASGVHGRTRAVRQCRTRAKTQPFDYSALGLSDSEDDDLEEHELDDVIPVVPTRKRKRNPSPSPERQLPSDDPVDLCPSDTDSTVSEPDDSPVSSSSSLSSWAANTTVHLTVNIPVGHQGPVTLHLDPKTLSSVCSTPTPKPDRLAQSTMARLNTRSSTRSKTRAGFLDLPAELRNEIYRLIFVTDKSINFSNPENFSRSAQLLRSCGQVYEEGRSILYAENRFCIERRAQRYGSIWEHSWRELGYLPARKFLKAIRPHNVALVRHATMVLEDAVPCLNPKLATNEERRFVNDDDLISVLRHLGAAAQLQSLALHFHGRRRVDRTDARFLDYLKRLKADDLAFPSWPPGSNYPRESKQDEAVKHMLKVACTRRKKKFN